MHVLKQKMRPNESDDMQRGVPAGAAHFLETYSEVYSEPNIMALPPEVWPFGDNGP